MEEGRPQVRRQGVQLVEVVHVQHRGQVQLGRGVHAGWGQERGQRGLKVPPRGEEGRVGVCHGWGQGGAHSPH